MAFLPAVLMTAGIAFLSLWEQPHLPQEIAMHDKIMHGLMYTVLAVSWMAPIGKSHVSNLKFQIRSAVWVCIGATTYGGLMEILQRFCTRTRSGELADLYADAIGAFIGVVIVVVITKSRNHVSTNQSPITNHQ